MLYYGCFPRGRPDNKENKDKDKAMKKMMMTEDKGEAAKVEAVFEAIQRALAEGKTFEDADCYCADTISITDFMEDGIDIHYGTIVYVYRGIGNGEAVWDIYKFGYNGDFAVSKDNEGDVAGLVNAGFGWFPF